MSRPTLIYCRSCNGKISSEAKYPPCPHCGDKFVTNSAKIQHDKEETARAKRQKEAEIEAEKRRKFEESVALTVTCRTCYGKVKILGRDKKQFEEDYVNFIHYPCPHCKDPHITEDRKKLHERAEEYKVNLAVEYRFGKCYRCGGPYKIHTQSTGIPAGVYGFKNGGHSHSGYNSYKRCKYCGEYGGKV